MKDNQPYIEMFIPKFTLHDVAYTEDWEIKNVLGFSCNVYAPKGYIVRISEAEYKITTVVRKDKSGDNQPEPYWRYTVARLDGHG